MVVFGGVILAAGLGAAASALATRSGAPVIRSSQVTQAERGVRDRTQPGTWKRGTVSDFKTVKDREKARAASIELRASRRAFDGAPPVMPHSAVFGDGTKVCLDCHSEGMTIGKRVAHPMSHPPLANCVQCHVESTNRMFPAALDPVNTFEGLPSAGPGPRWTPVAPPQVPHDITMRTHCLSCHGEYGYPGIRTEHPMRANCVQCHVTATRTR
jgi:cytochrome c-type protein NapB